MSQAFRSVYFRIRPFLPVRFRSAIRRTFARRKLPLGNEAWPIDESAGKTPAGWPGWPGSKQFAFVLTHDVETQIGIDRSRSLADLEESAGFRSSFNFVPEGDYRTSAELRAELARRGFEVGVHDLHHDGKLYTSRAEFRRRATRINHYLREWGAVGFRSAFMLHRLDWLHDLDVAYDASTFDIDPHEPQPDGAGTIFPFWVAAKRPAADQQSDASARRANVEPSSSQEQTHAVGSPCRSGYVELPYTLPQDSTLFIYLGYKDNECWKQKLDWIARRGGMVLVNIHPDYLAFDQGRNPGREFPIHFYRDLLEYVRRHYAGAYWNALPRDVASHVRDAYPEGGPRRPRKVCMLAYSFYESDSRIMRYAQALANRGDQVDAVALENPKIDNVDRLDATGVRIHRLQPRVTNERSLLDYATRIGSFLVRSTIHLHRWQNLRRYDLIHVHNVPDFLVLAAWYPRRRGAKIILDLHDLLPEFFVAKFGPGPASLVHKFLIWVERVCARFADHVIVSNALWLEKVSHRSKNPEHCSAFVNNVDDTLFRTSPRTRNDGRFIILFPGGLQKHQGLHIALPAFAIFSRQVPHAELRIVGEGPVREDLIAQAASLDLNHSVRFEPFVPLSEVPRLMADADLGIVPKLADGFGNEAYSTKIMEFMAAGLPVVASRTKIDEFYFREGEVHFFRSGDPEDMARAMLEVATNGALRQSLVRNGLEYARKNSWTTKSHDYLSLVDRLIGTGPEN